MRRFLAMIVVVCGLGSGCGAAVPPVETARIVVASSAQVLELVAQLLAQINDAAAKCQVDESPSD